MSRDLRAKIVGTGMCVPDQIVTNDDLDETELIPVSFRARVTYGTADGHFHSGRCALATFPKCETV